LLPHPTLRVVRKRLAKDTMRPSRITTGFTLIELLVVIAIIGVLSSVVLASLNTARSKGNDAAIQANLGTVKTQAQLYFDVNQSYGTGTTVTGDCASPDIDNTLFADQTMLNVISAVNTENGVGDAMCNSAATGYLMYSPLLTAGVNGWCVDSTGFAGSVASAPTAGSDITCN
jgi:prepilin-type N-terminal cleavage/methylation domain-containing protein